MVAVVDVVVVVVEVVADVVVAVVAVAADVVVVVDDGFDGEKYFDLGIEKSHTSFCHTQHVIYV